MVTNNVLIFYFLWMITTLVVNGVETYTKDKLLSKTLCDILDLMPMIVLALLPTTPALSIFILGICFANSIIRHNTVIGAIVYAITYIAINPTMFDNNIRGWIGFAIMSAITLIIAAFSLKKNLTDKKIILAGVLYSFFALGSLAYCGASSGVYTGFICLIVGDLLLALNFVKPNKFLYCVSNSFFYLGVYIVPFVLTDLSKIKFFSKLLGY